ncbi:hypothetical protein MIMGU_mgv1a021963mg [Erythranthe guttata]|uniref:F-box domain-containing protein n=1 Tax=Erythranthe guttata TaxID=4155 RepID=A0A022RN06_ERYGU|nr:hypothetical protein MIMGU_mgv1a021963mg [Erythranthe guttata]
MAAISEHRSPRRRKQNTVAIDQLSDLPDEVIFHILSFLQTKFHVRTSILSRRWRYLWLESCGVVPDIGGAVFFPRLKNLHLIQVQYESDESLQHLLSGCPVLEELSVELFIDYSSWYHHRVEINTPALVCLQLFDYSTQYIKCGELTALIEADIYICNNVKPEDGFLYSRSLMEFIDRLHNVKCLKLNLINYINYLCPIQFFSISFHNLTKLELTTDCYFLSKLHENADNLEILILSEVC